MSDVKRYYPHMKHGSAVMFPCATGTYVLYTDYAAKEAECARLREALKLVNGFINDALNDIVGNGWGDGDFAGYGGTNKRVQMSAMGKLEKAIRDAYQGLREIP